MRCFRFHLVSALRSTAPRGAPEPRRATAQSHHCCTGCSVRGGLWRAISASDDLGDAGARGHSVRGERDCRGGAFSDRPSFLAICVRRQRLFEPRAPTGSADHPGPGVLSSTPSGRPRDRRDDVAVGRCDYCRRDGAAFHRGFYGGGNQGASSGRGVPTRPEEWRQDCRLWRCNCGDGDYMGHTASAAFPIGYVDGSIFGSRLRRNRCGADRRANLGLDTNDHRRPVGGDLRASARERRRTERAFGHAPTAFPQSCIRAAGWTSELGFAVGARSRRSAIASWRRRGGNRNRTGRSDPRTRCRFRRFLSTGRLVSGRRMGRVRRHTG